MAQLARGGFEEGSRLIHDQRRQWILAAARRFERIATVDLPSLQVAGLSRHAKLVFDAIVEGLEVGVCQRPIGQRAVFRDGRCAVALECLGTRAEVILVKAP